MSRVKAPNTISFDLWDTLLIRKCHPDEVKLFTARYIYLRYYPHLLPDYQTPDAIYAERRRVEDQLAQQSVQQGQDDEYSVDDVIRSLLSRITVEGFYNDQIAEDVLAAEVAQEKYVTELNEDLLESTSHIESKNRVYISDFYMSGKRLSEILEHVGAPKYRLFVSCDRKLNKRSGKLYDYVQNELGIKPEDHLHFGDNEESDVRVPKSKGINISPIHHDSYIYGRNARFERRHHDFSYYIEDLRHELGIVKSKAGKDCTEMYELGVEFSALFIVFILYILEEMMKRNESELFYFTREGIFFQEIHRSISQHNPYCVDLPSANLLEVSRLATFAPSLGSWSCDELMRIWNQYPSQSARTLFKSIGTDIEPYAETINGYGISTDEEIKDPWLDKRVIALFDDPKFRSDIEREIAEKRSSLKGYLANHGVSDSISNLNIVDIGWRGTIQDNLCRVLPNTQITGYYFSLVEFLNEQPRNSSKYAFLPEDKRHMVKYAQPLEMLCNSSTGSVAGYLHLSDSEFVAATVHHKAEDDVFLNHTCKFQKGVLAAVPAVCAFMRRYAMTVDDMRPYVYQLLQQLVSDPPMPIVLAYLSLEHDEQFGLGKLIKSEALIPANQLFKYLISGTVRADIRSRIGGSAWPDGYLKATGLLRILRAKNALSSMIRHHQ